MTTVNGGNGADTLIGTSDNDILDGGNGQDSLNGGAGNDTLSGGNGDDLLDGGAGTDSVYGGNGDDTAVYVASENIGQSDFYDGGKGVDTLRLMLTRSQADSAAVRSDIQAYQTFLALYGGSTTGPTFQFTAFDLAIRNFERLDVVVVPGGNQAPTDIALSNAAIAENSAAGTIIGALTASDPDGGDTLTFTLLDNAGGRFATNGTNLVVAGALDFEAATSHQVTVRVTDAAGAFHDETFAITVTDVASLHVVGDNNSNVLNGGPEDDWIEGLGGNDRLLGGAGNDLLDGGSGNDNAAYQASATGSLTINLAAGTVFGAGIGNDTLVSIEGVGGGNFADLFDATGFSGTSVNAGSNGTSNFFQGNGGDDTIIGNGNTQIQYFNATAGVTVDLAAGIADGNASVGHDTFTGVNAVTGSNFDDVLLGTDGNDRFDGRAGNDLIDGRGNRLDQARYGDDANITSGIVVNLATGIVGGDASIGTDTLRSIETVSGTRFNDTYDATGFSGTSLNAGSADTWNQYLGGQGGNDFIIGNGETQLNYSNLASAVAVNMTTGTASYGSSQDTFSGVNSVVGTNANDTFIGSNTAGFGAEAFQPGAGNDLINGAGGFDIVMYGGGAAVATGGIQIQLANGIVIGNPSVGTDTLRSIDSVVGTNFDDLFDATGFSSTSTNAGEFGIDGMHNNFQGLGGNDTIIGNGATQLLYEFASGGIVANFQTGIVTGNASVGIDTFSGVRNLNATSFDDHVIGDDNGQDLVTWGGNDTIFGHGGDDFIQAGDGDDTIDGGAGADNLSGGGGNDTFVFADGNGADTITDFAAGAGTDDVLDLTGVSGVQTPDDVLAIASDDGTDTTIDFGSGNAIVLQNVLVSQLHQDDFLFA